MSSKGKDKGKDSSSSSSSSDSRVNVNLGQLRNIADLNKKLRRDVLMSDKSLPLVDICKNPKCVDPYCGNVHTVDELKVTKCPTDDNCLHPFTCHHIHSGEDYGMFLQKVNTLIHFVKNPVKYGNMMMNLSNLNYMRMMQRQQQERANMIYNQKLELQRIRALHPLHPLPKQKVAKHVPAPLVKNKK